MVIPTKKSNALTKLERLYQGKRPFEQYLADFLILKAESGLKDESYLTRRFVNGLNERLRLKTMTMGKSTWDLQTHIDTIREWKRPISLTKGFTPFQPRQSLSQGVPMDVDKKKSTHSPHPESPQTHSSSSATKLRKRGACFKVQKTRSTCPANAPVPTPPPFPPPRQKQPPVKGRIVERL